MKGFSPSHHIGKKEKDALSEVVTELWQASRGMNILKHISWEPEIKQEFFKREAFVLPPITYPEFDPKPILNRVTKALKKVRSDGELKDWVERIGASITNSAMLLANAGTPEFFGWSKALFGCPKTAFEKEMGTPLQLAKALDKMLATLTPHRLVLVEKFPEFSAFDLEKKLKREVKKFFGSSAPEVQVVNRLSAKALAGRKRIRILRSATFTDRDLIQLLQHEAFVHVATALNGNRQKSVPILGISHAGTTKTQEGLAVFGEIISGSIDPERMKRLGDRVLAIQMAIDGADFTEVFRFFRDRTDNPDLSFENTRRVFRGGDPKGRVPFTKDIVYLEGLLRVHNYLRMAVSLGRSDLIRLLFVGKLDLEDLGALAVLNENKMLEPPKFLPPWALDIRFLVSSLAYSAFLNRTDLTALAKNLRPKLEKMPPVVLGRCH